MVRLVFRPYTQVRRTICTSVSLRASIRVSPDFALLRHSSPSFGSQQPCSHSTSRTRSVGRWCLLSFDQKGRVPTSARHCTPLLSLRIRVSNTQILARMLDSLVRVSRRVNENHLCQHRQRDKPPAIPLRWRATQPADHSLTLERDKPHAHDHRTGRGAPLHDARVHTLSSVASDTCAHRPINTSRADCTACSPPSAGAPFLPDTTDADLL